MKTPHKHAELIKAWADGAEIEYLGAKTGWIAILAPSWDSPGEYRVKPEPKPDVFLHVAAVQKGFGSTSTGVFPAANLKLTFDGETGKLKAAEVL